MADLRRWAARAVLALVLYAGLGALPAADGLAGAAGTLLVPAIAVLLYANAYWR